MEVMGGGVNTTPSPPEVQGGYYPSPTEGAYPAPTQGPYPGPTHGSYPGGQGGTPEGGYGPGDEEEKPGAEGGSKELSRFW